MLTNFKYIGASFKKANLSLRESISLNETECTELISEVKNFCNCSEILIISTCNRTGIYYNHPTDISNEILKLWGLKKGLTNILKLKDNFLQIKEHKEAVKYLFRVSMGLESQVIGDIQISNQFKKAYQLSVDLDACGPFTHRLLHSVFFTNKRVVQETSYRDGTASVSYASSELISDFATKLKNAKVLIIGLGEMGADVARNLRNNDNISVSLSNRTIETANSVAKELNYNVIPFSEVQSEIENHDIILSAAQVEKPIITKDTVSKNKNIGYKYFIDLSLPRSIDPSVTDLPGTIVYNIDNIKSQTQEVIDKRIKAIPHVEEIISDAIKDFDKWEQEMEVSPTIQKLKGTLEDIRKEEIARHLKSIDNAELEKIEVITKGIMQKIIKLPVMQLKAACKRGEAETLIDVLNDLFNLENEETITK